MARPLLGTIGRCEEEEEEEGSLTHASLLIVANYWVEAFPSGSWGEKNRALRAPQLGFICQRFGGKGLSCFSGHDIFKAAELAI